MRQANVVFQDLKAACAAHLHEMVDQAIAFFTVILLREGPTPPMFRALRSTVATTTRQAAGAAIANIFLAIRVLPITHSIPYQGDGVTIFRGILDVGTNRTQHNIMKVSLLSIHGKT